MGRWCMYITHLKFSELLLSSLSFPLSRERQPQIDAYSPFSISILVHHIHTRALDLIITSKLPFCKALCTYTYPWQWDRKKTKSGNSVDRSVQLWMKTARESIRWQQLPGGHMGDGSSIGSK